MRVLLLFIALAGCSKILGIGDLTGGGDASLGTGEAGPDGVTADGNLSEKIRVSGKVYYQDTQQTTAANVLLGFHRLPDEVILDQASSDAAGMYTLSLSTGGNPVLGYLHANALAAFDAHDTYFYPANPLTADTTTDILFFSSNALQQIALTAGTNYNANQGFAIVSVMSPTNTGVAGAVIRTQPQSGLVRYFADTGALDPALTSTSTFGAAVVFNVPVTTVVFSASVGVNTASRTIKLTAPSTLFVGVPAP